MSDKVFILNSNGGWCWYQDDRVILDRDTGAVVCTSIATGAGADGSQRDGDVDISSFDPESGSAETFPLSNILTSGHGDDHNVAAVWQRPDGRYLAVYTGHNQGNGRNLTRNVEGDTQPLSFYRISQNPSDITSWQEEKSFLWPSSDLSNSGRNHVTYSNLHYLASEGGENGRLYNIARASGQIWQIATSDDWGETWTYRGPLTRPPEGGRDYSNGYMKFYSNGTDRIDFIVTEAHPRDFNNGVYHGYIFEGKTHDSLGKVVDPDTFGLEAPMPEAFTPLFAPKDVAGDTHHHGWTTELIRDDNGVLHALYTTRHGLETSPIQTIRPGVGDNDHRIYKARLDEGQWVSTELARMGPGLYDSEEDYTGLGTIDPENGTTLYVATAFDPRDNSEMPNRELFKGVTADAGKTWEWQPVTRNSGIDNLRPRIIRLKDGRRLLIWLRGTYHSMLTYDLQVAGIILDN